MYHSFDFNLNDDFDKSLGECEGKKIEGFKGYVYKDDETEEDEYIKVYFYISTDDDSKHIFNKYEIEVIKKILKTAQIRISMPMSDFGSSDYKILLEVVRVYIHAKNYLSGLESKTCDEIIDDFRRDKMVKSAINIIKKTEEAKEYEEIQKLAKIYPHILANEFTKIFKK